MKDWSYSLIVSSYIPVHDETDTGLNWIRSLHQACLSLILTLADLIFATVALLKPTTLNNFAIPVGQIHEQLAQSDSLLS
jgi:hypothetical protein